jgi:hypothetical protein
MNITWHVSSAPPKIRCQDGVRTIRDLWRAMTAKEKGRKRSSKQG